MKKSILFTIPLLFSFNTNAADTAVINTVYSTIIQNYIEPVSADKLAIAGLKGIKDMDSKFTFADGAEMVYLYHNGRQISLWKKPKDNKDIKAWIELTDKAIETTKKKSYKLKDRDYQITEKILSAAVESLGDSSKYHPYTYDEDDANYKSSKLRFTERMVEDVLYIRVANFNDNMPSDIKNAIDKRKTAKGIIIDLRGNQGGSLQTAIEIAKLFLDEGSIILSVRGKEGESIKFYTSDNEHAYNLPIAVLIDSNTASAAEVLAAALQDQAGAKLVGTVSYGKGSIQDTYTFENGGKLALTSAYFYTPAGKKIEGDGLVPDYCTFRATENDNSFKSNSCSKESREGKEVDIEVAVSAL